MTTPRAVPGAVEVATIARRWRLGLRRCLLLRRGLGGRGRLGATSPWPPSSAPPSWPWQPAWSAALVVLAGPEPGRRSRSRCSPRRPQPQRQRPRRGPSCSARRGPCRPPSGRPWPWSTCRPRCRALAALAAAALPVVLGDAARRSGRRATEGGVDLAGQARLAAGGRVRMDGTGLRRAIEGRMSASARAARRPRRSAGLAATVRALATKVFAAVRRGPKDRRGGARPGGRA